MSPNTDSSVLCVIQGSVGLLRGTGPAAVLGLLSGGRRVNARSQKQKAPERPVSILSGAPVAELGTNHLAGELRRVDRTRPLQSPSVYGDVALGLAHQLLALAIQLNCHLTLQKGRSTDLAKIRAQFVLAFGPKTLPQVLHSCVEMARDCRFPHLFWCQRCQREVDGVKVTSYPQHSTRRFRISCHKSVTEFWLTELVIAEHRDVLAPIDTAARASGFSLLRRYKFGSPAPSDREPDQPSVLGPRNPDLPTYQPH